MANRIVFFLSFLLIFSVLFTSCISNHEAIIIPSEIKSEEGIKNLKTIVLFSDSYRQICGGEFISPKTFITANHCIKGKQMGQTMIYRTFDQYTTNPSPSFKNATIVKFSEKDDLALLETEDYTTSWGVLATQLPDHGVVVGHPAGILYSHIYSALNDHSSFIVSTPGVAGGTSGGGLWNIETGELLGICIQRTVDGNHGIFVHFSVVRKFLLDY